MTTRYSVCAYWGAGPETPDECAPKVLRTFEALGAIDTAFAHWLWGTENGEVPVSSLTVAKTAKLIGQSRQYTDIGHKPLPELGYSFVAGNVAPLPRTVMLLGHVGAYGRDSPVANKVIMLTEPLQPENEAFITLGTLKPVLLALARIWDANWCDLSPTGLEDILARDKIRGRSRFEGGWATYLAAPFAAKIVPPRSAIVEQVPGGGLLMIATQERFDMANPDHLAVARDIDAALAPLE